MKTTVQVQQDSRPHHGSSYHVSHHNLITSLPDLSSNQEPTLKMDISSAVNINLTVDPNDCGPSTSRSSAALPTIPEPEVYRSTIAVTQPPPLKPKPQTRFRESYISRIDSEADSEDLSSPTWSVDDAHSELSSSTGGSPGVEGDSGISPDMDDSLSCDRVAAIQDKDMAVIVQVSCDHPETMEQDKYVSFIAGVTKATYNFFRRKLSEQSTLNNTQLEQLVLSDTRPVKEHIQDLSKDFSDHIVVQKATCRRAPRKGYVGVFVSTTLANRGNCSIGKKAVIVVLKKINKFAPTEEFASQLSQHIVSKRPEGLGQKIGFWATLGRRIKQRSPKHLLTQNFTFDPSVMVSEAARRSLVEVLDFVLYP